MSTKRSEISPEWIKIRREAIKLQGFSVRASPAGFGIELKGGKQLSSTGEWVGPVDNEWRKINLPTPPDFEDASTRDEILRLLTEVQP